MLIRYHAHHSRNKLPFWIQSNRYPVRQFRAYQLLGMGKKNPARHEMLQATMSQLEQKFVNHREDLVSKRSPRHSVIASDLFNTLAAIQVFLGKTAEAEKTIQQGFDF